MTEAGLIPTGSLRNAPRVDGSELDAFREWIHKTAGIRMSEQKRTLIAGRLAKRIRELGLEGYPEYLERISNGSDPRETQIAIDLLTTNETRFFREMPHFEQLLQRLASHPPEGTLRIWSAACSSGEEPYSLAMTLAESKVPRWEVLASDISYRVLQKASLGVYPLGRLEGIPPDYLKQYCLRGVGSRAGTFAIDPDLARRVTFRQINLNEPLPDIGTFDYVFLRNVMIYFDNDTKRSVVERIAGVMAPGARLFIGHAESLHGVTDAVRHLAPSIYVRTRP